MIRLPDSGVTGEDRRRIIRGTLYSFLIQGFSVLLVFISNLLLVRFSDPSSYGLYVHVFNWVSILSVVVMGGRDDLVLAQLPRYAGGRHERLVALVRASNRWILLAALLTGGLFTTLLFFFPVATLSDHQPLFRIATIAVYLTACLSLNQLILQALNHIRLSQVIEKLVKPLLLIGLIGMVRILAIPVTARVLVILSCAVLALCCGMALLLVYRKLRRFTVPAVVPGAAASSAAGVPGQAGERLTGKTFYFFAISLFNLLATKLTMLMLPFFSPRPADIGIFNISYRFADLLIFPFFLMHTVLPQLFARHADTGRDYTQSLYNESNRLMTLLSLPLLLVNVLGGHFFLRLFGKDFTAGYTAMLYISLAQFLFSFFGPANTILMMQDREKYSAICLLGYVVVLSGLSWWLIPAAGITGGALAILGSSLVYNAGLAVILYRVCGIRSPFFSWLIPPGRRKRR